MYWRPEFTFNVHMPVVHLHMHMLRLFLTALRAFHEHGWTTKSRQLPAAGDADFDDRRQRYRSASERFPLP